MGHPEDEECSEGGDAAAWEVAQTGAPQRKKEKMQE